MPWMTRTDRDAAPSRWPRGDIADGCWRQRRFGGHLAGAAGRSVLAVCLVATAIASSPFAADADDDRYRWMSVDIEVEGLPAHSDEVPVTCPIDFTALRKPLGVAGAVDERSLRLSHRLPDGSEREVPVQFAAAPQPRRKRELLPDTVEQVSYSAEYAAGQAPEGVRVAGKLCWMARSDEDGSSRYRLRFGVPRHGRQVQVPYGPRNLRAFDADGRATPIRHFPRMQIRPLWPLDGVLHVSDNHRLVTSYHLGPAAGNDLEPARVLIRRPFFYPVNGPWGVGLTELGKPHDPTGSHAHHHSLWIAHADVAGHDFWSQRGGIIAHDGFESLEDGPVYCRIVQRTRWIADDKAILHGRRSITVYRAAGNSRLIDLDLQFTPAGTEDVALGRTSFGFLAARVAQSMTPFDGGGEILNARGDRNEQAAHLKRAEWLDQSGPVAPGRPASRLSEQPRDGAIPPRWAGIAIFDHPDNSGHPAGWHCRNDGWAGAALNIENPYTLTAGKSLRLRYRVLLHPHDASTARVGRRFDQYAAKPTLRLDEPSAETASITIPAPRARSAPTRP